MSESYENFDLDGKLEGAFKTYLETQCPDYTVAAGVDDADAENDQVTCVCMGGQEMPLGTGNYLLEMEIRVRTKLNPTDASNPEENRLATHRGRVKAVRDALDWDDLGSKLNAALAGASPAAAFYCFDPVLLGDVSQDIAGEFATTTKRYRCLCCEVDLEP